MTRKKKNQSQEQAKTPAAPESREKPKEPGKLESLRAERDDLMARLQRVSADYLNYQKRVQKDAAQALDFANEQLIKSLLGVLDDMDRALAAARENRDEDDPLLAGMQLVYDKALETLGKFGLTVIEAEGKMFDPELHAAILQQPSGEHPPMTILAETQTGYRLNGRTIRPSAVIVSKRPEEADATPEENGQPRDN